MSLTAQVTRIKGNRDGLRFGWVQFSDQRHSGFHYDMLSGRVGLTNLDTALAREDLSSEHLQAATVAVWAMHPPVGA